MSGGPRGDRYLPRSCHHGRVTELASPVERAVETLDRLRRHALAIRQQERTARDDLAVVLHLLVGTGEGYGVIKGALDELGVGHPSIHAWGANIPTEVDGLPLMFGIRAVNDQPSSPLLSLPDVLNEHCLRFAMPGLQPEANWSWAQLIREVRNKFGGHVDGQPPAWLQDLRYYPTADTDAVTFLLWSIGEAVLTVTTQLFADNGVKINRYVPTDNYLNGISFAEGQVLGVPNVTLDVRALLDCKNRASGSRRPILGAYFDSRPFILFLERDGSPRGEQGKPGESLRDFERRFRAAPPPGELNRAARRATAQRGTSSALGTPQSRRLLVRLRSSVIPAPWPRERSSTLRHMPREALKHVAWFTLGGLIAVALPLAASHLDWDWYNSYWESFLITAGVGVALGYLFLILQRATAQEIREQTVRQPAAELVRSAVAPGARTGGDVTPPRILELSIEPAAIQVGGGPAQIRLSARLVDDLSGLAGEGYSSSPTQIRFQSPSARQFVDALFEANRHLVEGTARDGQYETTATIPQFAESGIWRVAYCLLVDQVGNSQYLAAEEMQKAGLATSFTVESL